MKIGTVLGEILLESCLPGWESVSCKQVRLEDGLLVAADLTGTKTGDLVLLTQESSANGYRMELRCDALIVGKVEKQK